MYTLHISNRDYTEWNFVNNEAITISPLTNKLFHGDQVDVMGNLISSPYRTNDSICGVLLTSQKTYGRMSANDKLLYKCVPDDEHLPCFLVPYEEKNIGFTKTRGDKYITFRVKEWLSTKHPLGLLTNTFGEVEDKEAYITYQMTCRALNDSLKHLNTATLRSLRENTLGPIPLYCHGIPFEDRRPWRILSIDPAGCMDIDDAIGIRALPEGRTMVSIYIANVPMMLEYLNLWPYLTDRVSTIYLPQKKHPMLPSALSENICSLKEKEDRLAFVMDITMKNGLIQSITYTSVIIRLEKNYAYEAAELLAREDYKNILTIVRELNDTYESRYMDKIANSHDMVEYCMLFMNRECAKNLKAKKRGIFRSALQKYTETDYTKVPSALKRVLQTAMGEYGGADQIKPHELLGMDCYVHITSPIRRLVDVVNMLALLEENVAWSVAAKEFLVKWQKPDSIVRINEKTKAARKLQNEMELLDTYEKNPDRTYLGIVFNKTQGSGRDNKALFKYKVYLPETKMLTSITIDKNDIADFTETYFSAHLFLDETKMTKKIRLQMI
jgi:exoribonuclease R